VKFDPFAQYYSVQYVADRDVEEYDEFELSQLLCVEEDTDTSISNLPKYGIGTLVGKFFDVKGTQKFYSGDDLQRQASIILGAIRRRRSRRRQ
jgi:hypothetical protein